MIEKKFRAWDTESKIMRYDDYCLRFETSLVTGKYGEEFPEMIPLQYTGLKDSKNNEIYEGDILDFDEREWGGKFVPEVIEFNKIIGEWEYCGSPRDVSEWRTVIFIKREKMVGLKICEITQVQTFLI